MTTIQMITNDQTLIAVQSPKVAAGDVNSTILHVDFDETWNSFISKSAVFNTTKDSTVHEVLLTDNECIIPASVLAEEGILFVGVRGITADNEAVKTSTLVKYKIVEGATASQKTIYPALDMYQQYLAALKNEADPILNAIRAEVEAYKAELKTKFDALESSYVKSCDYSNLITTLNIASADLTAENEYSTSKELEAPSNCWVSFYFHGCMNTYARLSVDGVALQTLESSSTSSGIYRGHNSSLFYVRKGSKIKLFVDASSGCSAWCKVYGCIE